MEIFGLPLQEFIFTIFLPFIFFYLLLYALLRKSKILGEPKEANRLNVMLSLVISALGILSLYSLGFTLYLPYFAAFTAVAAFVIMYLMGMFGYAHKKTSAYISGEAFKTEEEKKFDSHVKDCENIWKRFKAEKRPELVKEMAAKVAELELLAKKLGKSLYEYDWFNEFLQLAKAGGE
jgi:predicted membrane channel-forming protein YqfA (hemolysin III family)